MATTIEYKKKFVAAGSEIERDLLRLFRKEDQVHIADIGACDGLSTVIYHNIFPNAIHYCFEPVKENMDEM